MTTQSALVTGASSGLGAAFARARAAEGTDLILTARRAERLEALAATLRAAHGVRVATVALDLAVPGAPERLVGEIGQRGLSVDLLVNNAGFGLRGPFVDMDHRRLGAMIDLNCRAVMELSQLVLPGMIQMRQGAILNVASIAGLMPGPWMAAYYASKAFVLSFSQSLHEEVRRHGVRVVALCPGPVATEFGEVSGLAKSRLFRAATAEPEAVVRAGLKALRANRTVAIPGLSNRLIAAGGALGPRIITRRITGMAQKLRGG